MRTNADAEGLLREYRIKLHTAVHHTAFLKKGVLAYIGYIMYSCDQYTGAPCIIIILVMLAYMESLLANLLEIDNN